MLNVQKESLDLLEENKQLKDRIKELEDNREIDKSLIFKYNCYYKVEDKDYEEPLCTNCWDTNRKLVRMHVYSSSIGPIVQCNACKVDFYYDKR